MEKNRNKLNNIIWFLFLIVYLECIYKIFVFKNLFSLDTIFIIFFSVPISILLYLISNLYKHKLNKILSIIICTIIMLVFASQFIYFSFYESIFSIFSLTNGTGQAMDFISTIWSMLLRNYLFIILILLPIIFYTFFGGKVFTYTKMKTKNILITAFIMILSYFGTLLIIYFDRNGVYSLNKLYFDNHAPILTVNKMGLLTMERLDIKRFIFGFEEKLNVIKVEKTKEEIVLPTVEYNVTDINFDNLIANESNETIINMHKYFSSVAPTEKNEYTGMFKDKNLIYITAEGLDSIAIDENITPTLYKMVNNGFVFNNYYQPLFTVSTSDGEYMNMTSLIPKEGIWSTYRSSNIYLPYALGNTFNKLGYISNAWHDNTYSYYKRNYSHPNMGFNYVGCGNGLEKLINCKRWPESDLEMIDATAGNYINENKFLTYYITVSGHLNYTFNGNSMSSKNKSLVENLPYSSKIKAYLAANIEFDKAMGKLLKYLTDAGKIDDTLIVISPDHYPYGLSIPEINEKSSINRDDTFNLYKTSLIMYNPKIKTVKIDKYVSSIDILPTVYNLFGVAFDSRLLMGRDALSKGDGLVMLSNRSWINEKGSFNSISNTYTSPNGINDEEYLTNINSQVYQKFTMSSLILSESNGKYIDYFKKLGI